MSTTPNIFEFATSELSQDAFIAWLLKWAAPEFKKEDAKLHNLGKEFLGSLLAKGGIPLKDIEELEVKTQHHRIDVFASFKMEGKSYGLIIEDKVFSSNHSNQLTNYLNTIDNKGYDVVVPIYFKTGFQHSYEDVESKKYFSYTVKDFTKVLKTGKEQGVSNSIVNNYYDYIIVREQWFDGAKSEFDNYKTTPLSEWTWWSCTGFFHNHHKELNANWGPVANNRESLLAIWTESRDLNILDADTNNPITLKPYVDMLFSGSGNIRINFRIGNIENHHQTNNKNRNHIYHYFYSYLQENNITHKKPVFRKSKGTIQLAQVLEIDKNLNYLELKDLLNNYKTILFQFIQDYNNNQLIKI